jgi:hypothetical protein
LALGEQIGEEKGTVTAFRVVKDGFGVKVESQFQGQGTMLGVPFVDYATYASVYRPDGNFTGTADGVIFTQEAEAASYTGTGVGHMLGKAGAASWRGALYFFSASPHFAQMNSIAVLFEFEIGENARDMEIKYFEWK